MPELYSAILNPHGPNYASWHAIFGDSLVPVKSAASVKVDLGAEKDVEVYLLNLAAMTLRVRARLLGAVAQELGCPVYEVEAEFSRNGLPIRAEDMIVSVSVKAFV
jgi:hypothetical protein